MGKKQTGFTIVELLIVIVVIGILAAIVIVAYNGVQTQAKTAALKSELTLSAGKIEAYRYAAGNTTESYPTGIDCTASPAAGTICISSNNVTYQYTGTTGAYCLTAVTGTIAFNISSTVSQVTSGVCSGHADPNATVVAGNSSLIAGSGAQAFTNGTGASSAFAQPNDIAVDSSGNMYIADLYNNSVRKITPAGAVSTFATGISYPEGIDVDSSGNVYVASLGNNNVVKITSGGVASVFVTGVSSPRGIAVSPSGDIYVADTGNAVIKKVTPSGVVTIFAGTGSNGSTDSSTPTSASFNGPYAIAFDTAGNAYVADYNNSKIRKISTTGAVTTLAGSGTAGYAEGTGAAAQFYEPSGIAADSSGNVYVGDSRNNRIRKITPAGVTSSLMGTGTGAYAEGLGSAAAFNYPAGIAFGSDGTMYIADRGNNRIRKAI